MCSQKIKVSFSINGSVITSKLLLPNIKHNISLPLNNAGKAILEINVEDDQLDAEVEQITTKLARTSADAMKRIRSVTDAALSNGFSDQLDLEMEHQAVLIPKNMAEGARAFVEKREPEFPGRK